MRFQTLACVVLAVLASPAFGELPSARLTSIFPPGGRAGAKVQVTIRGTDLDGAMALRFSEPGITATPADGSESATERRFTVEISPDAAVGKCDVRFVGAYGISNPRAFSVSDRPEIVRIGGDKHDEHAAIAIGSIVNARCGAGTADSYDVELNEGQRVLFACATREIDSKLSPVMVLIDGASHEVERSRHGGLLDFTVPRDGAYKLQIHDLLYRGGPEYFYRLEVGVGPHLDAVFPPAGQAGSKAAFSLFGRNLPGGRKSDLRAADGKLLDQLDVEIELPPESSAPLRLDAAALTGTGGWAADAFAYHLASEQGASNPILIGLTRSPLTFEREPNDEPSQAQKLQPPVEVAGRFYPHGDRDWFAFDATRGEVYWIEIASQRLGLPSDPSVMIQHVARDQKGIERVSDVQEITSGNAAGNGGTVEPAFGASMRDGAFRLEAKDGGLYRLLVRDLFNTADDNAALTYRLSIRREQPDFRMAALPIPGAPNEVAIWSPFLRKGGAVPVRLVLVRQDGFNGEVRVEAEGLPGDVKCSGGTIPAGQSAGTLVLSAADDAAEWRGPVTLVGRATANREQLARQVRIGTVIWPGNPNVQEPPVSRSAEDFALAVSGDEQEPITFIVDDNPIVATVGGKVKIAVKIRRNLEIKSALKITPAGAITTAKDLTFAPGASEGSLEIDLAQQKLSPGLYTFLLEAQGQVAYQRKSIPSPGGKGDGKKSPEIVQATCYSPALTLKVVAKGEERGK